jgi:hypothetical protein
MIHNIKRWRKKDFCEAKILLVFYLQYALINLGVISNYVLNINERKVQDEKYEVSHDFRFKSFR